MCAIAGLAQARERRVVVGDAVDQDRHRALEVAAEQDRRALARDAQAGDDRAHAAHLEHELGAELVDVAARGEVDVRGRHVHVVERLEDE